MEPLRIIQAEQFLKAHEYDETVPVNYDEFNHEFRMFFKDLMKHAEAEKQRIETDLIK